MGDVMLSAEEAQEILDMLGLRKHASGVGDHVLDKLRAAIRPSRPEPTYERWWVTAGAKELAHSQHVLDWADWMADHPDAEVLVPESLLLEALANASPEHYIERLSVTNMKDAATSAHCSCGWRSHLYMGANLLAAAYGRHLEEVSAA